MARKMTVKKHLSLKEINVKIKKTIGFWRVQRWQIIYQAMQEKLSSKELAERFGVSQIQIKTLLSQYNRFGESAVDTKGKGQRQRAYLTQKEEKIFLEKFINKASKGGLITTQQIHEEFEKKVKRKVSKSTIYRLLKRNGWRKIEPRPMPLKSKEERDKVHANFKKTSKIK